VDIIINLVFSLDFRSGYVHDRPPFDVVKNIIIAANCYDFDQFVKFSTKCMKAFFPRNVQDITSSDIPNSIEAIVLAREYSVHTILPAAFYQLARTKPSINDDELKKLEIGDFIMLSNVQKQSMLLWDDIFEIVGHNCQLADCVIFHTQHVQGIKKRYPLDPIMGMHKLIKYDWVAAKEYCPTASKNVVNKLRTRRLQFWDDMKVWLECDDSDSDSETN
jgi:hypothetical protein